MAWIVDIAAVAAVGVGVVVLFVRERVLVVVEGYAHMRGKGVSEVTFGKASWVGVVRLMVLCVCRCVQSVCVCVRKKENKKRTQASQECYP